MRSAEMGKSLLAQLTPHLIPALPPPRWELRRLMTTRDTKPHVCGFQHLHHGQASRYLGPDVCSFLAWVWSQPDASLNNQNNELLGGFAHVCLKRHSAPRIWESEGREAWVAIEWRVALCSSPFRWLLGIIQHTTEVWELTEKLWIPQLLRDHLCTAAWQIRTTEYSGPIPSLITLD